jgi:hypothetical protein
MDAESGGGKKAKQKPGLASLPPGVEARATRRLAVLLGLVPLPRMTQEEADWLFRQKVRTATDE